MVELGKAECKTIIVLSRLSYKAYFGSILFSFS